MSGSNGSGPLHDRIDTEALASSRDGFVPDPDELYGALCHAERRRVLAALLEERTTRIEELADVLAGWEATERGVVGAEDRNRTLTRLHHVHLPKLAAVGLIDYSPDTGDVALASLAGPVEELVRFTVQYDRAYGGSVR